jgi:hypothetical protein
LSLALRPVREVSWRWGGRRRVSLDELAWLTTDVIVAVLVAVAFLAWWYWR